MSENQIVSEENTERQLRRLAAQRHLYSTAKRILWFQFLFVLILPVVASFIAVLSPSLRSWVALYGLIISIVDASILEYWQGSLKLRAARVQELFDCDVLQLGWRSLKTGSRPDPEFINEWSAQHAARDPQFAKLRDWYPAVVAKLPLHLARLACQRINCWYDGQLRQKYIGAVVTVLVVSGIAIFIIAFVGGFAVNEFALTILAPLLPVILWSIREYRRQTAAIATLRRLKEWVEQLWSRAVRGDLTAEQATLESRYLQDEIFEHRHTSPLLFDFIYKLLLSSSEQAKNKGTTDLVEEALQRMEYPKPT